MRPGRDGARDRTSRAATLVRAGARGLVAAMAMSGMRSFTASAGLLEKSPPVAIMEEEAPEWIRRIPGARHAILTELAHWAYGATGGVAFGLLPLRVRVDRRAGPVFGLAIWATFELGVAPLLGIRYPERRQIAHRAMLALDHMMYGFVVAGRLAPPPELRRG